MAIPENEQLEGDIGRRSLYKRVKELSEALNLNEEGDTSLEERVDQLEEDLPLVDGRVGQLEEEIAGLDKDTYLDYAPSSNIDEGVVTSGTSSTIVDSTKEWEVDSLIDKILQIKHNDVKFYGLISSNTATEITCARGFPKLPSAQYEYIVLDIVELTAVKNKTVALDVRNFSCGILLPKSSSAIERKWLHIYIEKHDNSHSVPVMTRDVDTILGQPYGTLEHTGEAVRLYAHTYLTDHWDLLSERGIKRYASFGFTAGQSVPSDTYSEICDDIAIEKSKRFQLETIGNSRQLVYTSLVGIDALVSINLQIVKTGGTGDMYFTIRRYRGSGHVDFTSKEGRTRFGAGEGAIPAHIEIALDLQFGDGLVLIAKKTAQNFTIEDESIIVVKEL